jgi:hypothetical protein
MKADLKNCLGVSLGVVIMLCLGFVLGRFTMPPTPERVDVHPTLPGLEIGRYQLIVAEINLPIFFFDDRGKMIETHTATSGKTLFRMDTMTGDIVYYSHEQFRSSGDTLVSSKYIWHTLTQTELTETK